MALPSQPTNLTAVPSTTQILLTWDQVLSATGYKVYKSSDGITFTLFATIAITASPSLLVTGLANNVEQWFYVVSSNGSGDSVQSTTVSQTPVGYGEMSLAQLRLAVQQRADRVGSNFVTTQELNSYINQSYTELYDLLITVYQDYYIAPAASFRTDGTTLLYALPNGILSFTNSTGASFVPPAFYKLIGVDLGINTAQNAYVTMTKFNFVDRNRFVYPNTASTMYGVFNCQYRLLGNAIELIPTPTAGQLIRLWYIPLLTPLLQDTDSLIGVSGWSEYVITDAAIKVLQKEESDVSILMAQKAALIQRINGSATNRDAGMPDRISDTRGATSWGGFGNGGPGGSVGGW